MADLPRESATRVRNRGGATTETTRSRLRVLIVDDEPNVCNVLRDACSRFGYSVTTCNDGAQAIAEAHCQTFDVIFLDIRMPGMNGTEVLKILRRRLPRATFVMITAYAESELVDESLESGAFLCLSKPLSISEIKDLLEGLSDDREVAWTLLPGVEKS